MDRKKLERINELARKSRVQPLLQEEKEEQAQLRREYILEYREQVRITLEITYIVDEFGNKTKLTDRTKNTK